MRRLDFLFWKASGVLHRKWHQVCLETEGHPIECGWSSHLWAHIKPINFRKAKRKYFWAVSQASPGASPAHSLCYCSAVQVQFLNTKYTWICGYAYHQAIMPCQTLSIWPDTRWYAARPIGMRNCRWLCLTPVCHRTRINSQESFRTSPSARDSRKRDATAAAATPTDFTATHNWPWSS